MVDELHSSFCEGSILLLMKSVSLRHLGSESNLHLYLQSQLFDIFLFSHSLFLGIDMKGGEIRIWEVEVIALQ